MSWTAIVPIKAPGLGKTRLSGIMEADRRTRLATLMLDHLLDVLHSVPRLQVVLLCPSPPDGWSGSWAEDRGRGLNAELEDAACAVRSRLLVIHGDLPALRSDDVAALLEAADGNVAIAPDRHRTGTNALALGVPRRPRFAFGPGSFEAHCRAVPTAKIVDRPGLAHDLDTADDLAALLDDNMLDPAMGAALATIRNSKAA